MTETTISASATAASSAGDGDVGGEGEAGEKEGVFAGGDDLASLVGLCDQRVIWWPPRRWRESAMAVPQAPEPSTAMRLMRFSWLRSGIPCRRAGGGCSGGV